MMTAVVAAMMSTMVPATKATESIAAMATVVPATECDVRKAVSVTIKASPPIMAAVVSAVMAVSHLLNDTGIFDR